MRSTFPGHFRPTDDHFIALWKDSLFAIDSNVLLNLYRYSPETRIELERALTSVKERLFIPHQAAKEFLNNRLKVTADQAKEYTKAIDTLTDKNINELISTLSNSKKHPFLPDPDMAEFTEQVTKFVTKLENQRDTLLNRLTDDEILDFVELLLKNKTGCAFNEKSLNDIASDGDKRYKNEIPPGYLDIKKDVSGDPYRKFGDLIIWKQLIDKALSDSKPIIFITDDKKTDWWLARSGRTIGPRPELLEEFTSVAGQYFWMYTVDKFIAETSRTSTHTVSPEVIAEIIETRQMQQSLPTNQNHNLNLFGRSERGSNFIVHQMVERNVSTEYNYGIIEITIIQETPLVSVSGKFQPELSDIPSVSLKLLRVPDNYSEDMMIYYEDANSTFDFKINMMSKSYREPFPSGEYVFSYKARTPEYFRNEIRMGKAE